MTDHEESRPREENGSVHRISTGPGEILIQAAARILARHHHPEWRPANDAELDAWGHGFNTGWHQGYAAGRANG